MVVRFHLAPVFKRPSSSIKGERQFSDEGREWIISGKYVDFSKLTAIDSPDATQIASSGLLIKGSETHERYLGAMNYVDVDVDVDVDVEVEAAAE